MKTQPMPNVPDVFHAAGTIPRFGRGCASWLTQGAFATPVIAVMLTLLSGCTAPGQVLSPMAPEQQVVIEGRVSSVDTSPMAYDGDALVLLESDARGTVTVHVPARTNPCRAQGLGLLGLLQPGDRLRVAGKASGPRDITVCEQPSHRLQKLH